MTIRFMALLALLPLAAACGDAAAQDPIELDSSCAETQLLGGEIAAWESAGWAPDSRCDWLPLDGRTTVDLSHGLGRVPRDVSLFVSFDPDGRMSAPSAGDLVRIVAADDVSVQLRNATNTDVFLKVVLR